MKTSVFLFSMAAALTIGMGASDALAQNRSDEAGASRQAPTAIPLGTARRYLVTYFRSSTAAAQRSFSVISITNQNTAACTVAVEWKLGFGGVVCDTNITLAAGNTAEFCTRPLGDIIQACNSTCAGGEVLNFTEGSAAVASSWNIEGCEKIGVSARTVYTGPNDSPITGITDAKVVRWRSQNIGD